STPTYRLPAIGRECRAPGANIACSDKDGSLVHVAGTSFAASICAGVAALVWAANPNLKNTQVDAILRGSSNRPGSFTPPPTGNVAGAGGGWSPYFGDGLPDV